jgi:vanillate/3-O-methylgallate O-demethylase
MKAYREWLPGNGYEATGSLGGSYYADDISHYYLTPHDLGYWGFVKFDHDFIGREALEAMGDEAPRRKVTLAWNGEDVAAAIGSLFESGDPAKYIDLPLSNYSTWPNDKLLLDGEMVGVSTFSGYSYNERSMLSWASSTATSRSAPRSCSSGARRTAARRSRWSSATARPRSARSSARSYSEVARTSYHEGWRTKATA